MLPQIHLRDWSKYQLTILSDVEHMSGIARYINHSLKLKMEPYDTRIERYLFANDIKMCTEICLSGVPIIQHEQYTTATSLSKIN